MYKETKPFFIVCDSPLHAGSGSDLGIVDLPIQRERHTGFPKIESSSLKGSIREAFENSKEYDLDFKRNIHRVFGFDQAVDITDKDKEQEIKAAFPAKDREFSSAIGFTDARLLFFPVKSVKSVFAWITCPSVLSRFKTDMSACGIEIKNTPKENTVPENSSLLLKDNKIVLEEYFFSVKPDPACNEFAASIAEMVFSKFPECSFWQDKMKKDIVVLSDNDFRDFVNLSTEVITRTKIDNTTGTVSPGALFTEEYLPSDSIMYSLAMASPIMCKNKGNFESDSSAGAVMEFFSRNMPDAMQIGGNYTLGKGLVKIAVRGA